MAALKKAHIETIFRYFSDQNPEPQTELNYNNHYTLLVAVVLSAQATDVGVNKATAPLFAKINTPEQMVALGEEGLKKYIKTIGLYHNKAKHVIALSERLMSHYDSTVPDNFDDLHSLPGVGIKTAQVVLNCAFGHETIAVDTHVFRVSNRLGIVKTTSPDRTGEPLLKKIPKPYRLHAHHWLILHGRYICKARKPLCSQCNISHLCQYKDKCFT